MPNEATATSEPPPPRAPARGWARRLVFLALLASLLVNVPLCFWSWFVARAYSERSPSYLPIIAGASVFSYFAYVVGRRKWSTWVLVACIAPSVVLALLLAAVILWIATP
jgi:hypothetical protein